MHKFCSSEQFYAITRIVPNTWFPLSGTKFTIISWILLRIQKFCNPEQFYAQVLQFGTILCNSKNCSEHVISVIWDQIYHNILNFTKNSQVLQSETILCTSFAVRSNFMQLQELFRTHGFGYSDPTLP